MKAMLAIAVLVVSATAASAQYYLNKPSNSYGSSYGYGSNSQNHYVQPHFNSNGSYTGGHYRSNPNNTQYDNWSTKGNVNPYTGAYGTRTPRY